MSIMSIELNVNQTVIEDATTTPSTCSDCSHKDICKYSDKLAHLYKDIQTKVENVEFISDVNIVCKHKTIPSITASPMIITNPATNTNIAKVVATPMTTTVSKAPKSAPLRTNVKDMDFTGIPVKEIDPNDVPMQFRNTLTVPTTVVEDNTIRDEGGAKVTTNV